MVGQPFPGRQVDLLHLLDLLGTVLHLLDHEAELRQVGMNGLFAVQKRMSQEILRRRSLLTILGEHFPHKILESIREIELVDVRTRALFDCFHEVVGFQLLMWNRPSCQLVRNNSCRPNVHGKTVWSVHEHLGSHHVRSSDDGVSLVDCVRNLGRDAKVRDFNFSLSRHEYIGALDVPVNLSCGVEVLDPF